jgi:hypothetical protein
LAVQDDQACCHRTTSSQSGFLRVPVIFQSNKKTISNFPFNYLENRYRKMMGNYPDRTVPNPPLTMFIGKIGDLFGVGIKDRRVFFAELETVLVQSFNGIGGSLAPGTRIYPHSTWTKRVVKNNPPKTK